MLNNRELLGSRRAELLKEAKQEREARRSEPREHRQRKLMGLVQVLQRIRLI